MSTRFSLFLLGLLFLLLSTCNKSLQDLSAKKPANNIILLIGDGMGLTQVSTAYYYGEQTPSFSTFKYIGLHQNEPTDKKITDSASGATAFSTGYKSYNAAIGVDQDTIARETILEWAAKNSKSTGLVATSSITHATPASFFAHVANRNFHEEIAADFIKAPVDFAAGGGYRYFNQRADEQNLLTRLEDQGVKVDTNALREDLVFGTRYAFLLGPDSLHSIRGGRGDFLPSATRTALNYLNQDKDGFFLMVEGSQIDWAGHNNDAEYLIDEVLDFDKAVAVALDFAKKEGNTLVIVTADHETGGLSLSSQKVFGVSDYGIINPTFSTGGHSASLIPVFAYGPGAEQFMGIYQNNDIFTKMMNCFSK
ncbi:MAG: alkaline phosphatase [Lewinella sp.]|uniref:alkaline phosphatase n=1 Tax=Lewinella sp. TaxID=2004506 RepID=UPI003D6B89FE